MFLMRFQIIAEYQDVIQVNCDEVVEQVLQSAVDVILEG
jgi:hypothetical protein